MIDSKDKKYIFQIENAYRKLRQRCVGTAKARYGNPLPSVISDRLETELDAIEKNGSATDFLIGAFIGEISRELGYPVSTRGLMGSTLTAFLCHFTWVNPLPAHGWCPFCQHFELIDEDWKTTGYDLENKRCPKCGRFLRGDGANILPEVAMGKALEKGPDLSINVADEIRNEIIAEIKEEFGEGGVYRAGTLFARGDGSIGKGVHPGAVFIMPSGVDIEDLTSLRKTEDEFGLPITNSDYHELWENPLRKYDILTLSELSMLRELEDKVGIRTFRISTNDSDVLDMFLKEGFSFLPLERERDFNKRIKEAIDIIKPRSFYELTRVAGMMHGVGAWTDNGENLAKEGIGIGDLIAFRDDIMQYLISIGIEKIEAYRIMNRIRMGKGLSSDNEKLLRDYSVPEYYIESCNKVQYLFPKAHAIEYMLVHWKLADYKLNYTAEYDAVMNSCQEE